MPIPSFPIVGIGASAGGLKAIEEMLRNLPGDTGMSFIIVQHLSRKYKSLMREILLKDTEMPVVMATNGVRLEPNHVYLIPAGQNLTVNQNELRLETQSKEQIPSFVIDILFHSLGKEIRENAIGIVLSGTGSDGSRGIRTIKEAGGIVLVQEPQSGEFDGMPLSALDTRMVDFVLPPHQISEKLVSLSTLRREVKTNARMKVGFPSAPGKPAISIMEQILLEIRKEKEVDFALYKSSTVERRIEKAMSKHDLTELEQYLNLLREDPEHVEELFGEMLIGVTEFFRDSDAYIALEKHVFPQIVNELRHGTEVRIWDCGCSTGEEVFSLAIAINEYADAQKVHPRIKILATDVDQRALQVAGRGRYLASRVEGLGEHRLKKYFDFNGQFYEVKKFLRDQVIFARNDATLDPPFINLDMVVCRNLLIYLQPMVQRKLLLNFHFGLKPGGYLWLGGSENILEFKNNFTILHEKWRIFQTRGETPTFRKYYQLRGNSSLASKNPRATLPEGQRLSSMESQLRRPASFWPQILLRQFAPASIVFDDKFEIQYIAGDAGDYLRLPNMELTPNLLSMVSKPMMILLRDALHKLKQEEQILYRDVAVIPNSDSVKDLLVKVIRIPGKEEAVFYLIEFRDTDSSSAKVAIPEVSFDNNQADTFYIIQDLQEQLRLSQQEVQSTTEELETSNEELQASNEELLASNEELQSTNEELQSVNEELYTVNSELQSRNRELSEAHTTIDSLLNSTELGTLFLDSKLRIRFFTEALTDLIPLREIDLGRPIQQFSFPFDYPDFQSDADFVLTHARTFEREIRDIKDNWYLVRMTPYREEPKEVDGLVLTFVNITARKQAELGSAQYRLQLSSIIDAIPNHLLILDMDGRINFYNQPLRALIGSEMVGKSLQDIWMDIPLEVFEKIISEVARDGRNTYHEMLLTFESARPNWMGMTFCPIMSEKGEVYQVLLTMRNIQESKTRDNELRNQITTFQSFLDQSPTPAWIKDHEFHYVYANPAFQSVLKLNQESIQGKNDFGLFGEVEARIMRENDQKVLSSGKSSQIIEKRAGVNDDFSYEMIVKFPIELDKKGTYLAGLSVDVTPIKRAEEDIKLVNEALEERVKERTEALIQANQELRTFTRSVAHDLRNPIRAVRSYSQILLESYQDKWEDEAVRFMKHILRQSDHMVELVNSLLGFAKLGTVPVRKQNIDMALLAKEVYQDLEYLREEKPYNFVLRSTTVAWADLELTKQVLTNLLSNAIKFSKTKASPQIEIGSFVENGTSTSIYYIKDNGIGFEQKYSDRIFNVFERLTPDPEFEGSGIGLSIVKRAIEIQNGSIWVNSGVGKGSTFFFTFPPKQT